LSDSEPILDMELREVEKTNGTRPNRLVKKRKTHEQGSNEGKSDEAGATGVNEENANLRAQLVAMARKVAQQTALISQLEVQ
jgi:hypothetical protein